MLTSHQISALDISNNIALTANAGSGKTFILSKRFLEIALSGNIPIRKIAAITFTEKAASELYKKIAAQVEDTIASSRDEKLINKLQQIRRSLVSANISTIHSFCINLLREYPVEAELDANFIPADTIMSNELIELSAEEVIKEALTSETDSPAIKSLIRLFSSKSVFTKEMINLVANRKNLLELRDRMYNKQDNEIAGILFSTFLEISSGYISKKLQVFMADLNQLVNNVVTEDPENKTVADILPFLKKLKDDNNFETLLSTLQQLSSVLCTKEGKIRKYLVRKLRNQIEEQYRIEEFLSDSSYFYFEDDHELVEMELAATGRKLLYFFDRTIARYNEKKNSKGYIDFEDILLYTKKLLENEDVKRSVWDKFEYIMIDEYQDTNEIQYEIFLPILDQLRRGNLFVVGDEKQSIYMFRDAELEVFERTKRQIGEYNSGKLLILPDSFRMGPDVCLFTNYVFKKLFADPDITFNEVAHSELVCARQDIAEGGIEFLLEEKEGIPEEELVSGKILELITTKKINWNQIAVLSRKRKSFDKIEESFINHKIPYLIMGGRNFYQRQSIYDIFNYFSFLLDNNNDGALAGILRSPFFNLSDSQLFEISLLRGHSFYRKLLSSENETLKPVKEKLSEMTDLAQFTDPPELLRKMLNESDFLAYLVAKKNGPQESANIRKLIKITINFYSHGLRTLYDYVNFLKTNIEQVQDEAQALIADDSNTVKIMTIHQAKGLEFTVIFLVNSGESAQRSMVRQKGLVVNKNLGILTKVPLHENYYQDYLSAPAVNLNNFISLKKENAELRRLLYVGVTRAKDFLYVTAARKENYPVGSFMELLTRAFPDGFLQDKLSIFDTLKFLRLESKGYSLHSQERQLDIPVETSVNEYNQTEEERGPEQKILMTEDIPDSVKDEIISATKFSVYTHCPRKYKFTYKDGLLPLINTSAYFTEDDNEKDNEITAGSAGIKGRVIHKILQEGKEQTDPEYVNMLVRKEGIPLDEKASGVLSSEIISDLEAYFASGVYNEIKNQEGKNEFEIYVREKDYILFGIIDRIIIKDDLITIIDYKTDDIPVDKTEQRAREYLNQLKFYSYIVWQTFNSSYRIKFRIIFVRHPDKYIESEETRNSLIATGNKISEMVENTRNNIFYPDKDYCSRCIYSIDHKNCIKRD